MMTWVEALHSPLIKKFIIVIMIHSALLVNGVPQNSDGSDHNVDLDVSSATLDSALHQAKNFGRDIWRKSRVEGDKVERQVHKDFTDNWF
ncbi:hypothetical protein CROQUDRAFT_723895 [Cronartium quercuum f. sp. fusiforme G11]|uniref:Uncharacterized protein n=1 Tax=Cronartium quercuum f. sp. fusiforme G11 TaxID=708437 RepID=A0A9P6T9Z6_9BASI|nr:hypothetical protein CROQUDRAFT_723895 [Cronartium quercuum f. sp. fusiforme G11]